MGWNFQDEKCALFVSFFVRFCVDLKSIKPSESHKKHPVDKYTKESIAIAYSFKLIENFRVAYLDFCVLLTEK